VVLVLHGLTQSMQRAMRMSSFNELAEEENFIAVYPAGLNAAWNVSGRRGGADDVGFLNAVLDSLGKWYAVDQSRMFSCGFSNGGFMSYKLACELSHRIAAVASVTGSMWKGQMSTCQPEFSVPVMQIHGTDDLIVDYRGNQNFSAAEEVVEYWRLKNGCTKIPEYEVMVFEKDSDRPLVVKKSFKPCMDRAEVVLLTLHGVGHIWPGSTVQSFFSEFFDELDASSVIWEFFTGFSKDIKE
jgi:polyhydroxybutyrate depolymerase